MPTAAAVYLPYLFATWAIEVPLLVYLLRGHSGWKRSTAVGLLASGITHPLLWFVWPRVVPLWGDQAYLASGETLVFLVEAALIWLFVFRGRRRGLESAALASLATNAASCAAGLLAAAW
jgi:hypothetical protein